MNLVPKQVTIRLPAFVLACAPFAWSQAVKEFDVTSIKPHKDDDGRVGISIAPGGLFRATNAPLNMLMQTAYDLRPGQLVGAPKWIDAARYDIEAKMAEPPPQNAGPDGLRPYLQSMLEQRFQLKSHREMRDMQVYQLVAGKGGPKMKEADAAGQGPRIRMGRGLITATQINMDQLARELSRQLGSPVVNQTGLTGNFDLELKFTPEGPAGPGGPGGAGGEGASAPGGDGPTIFTAIQEQLGLKLESKKSAVNVFVVDKIEKPEEN